MLVAKLWSRSGEKRRLCGQESLFQRNVRISGIGSLEESIGIEGRDVEVLLLVLGKGLM